MSALRIFGDINEFTKSVWFRTATNAFNFEWLLWVLKVNMNINESPDSQIASSPADGGARLAWWLEIF